MSENTQSRWSDLKLDVQEEETSPKEKETPIRAGGTGREVNPNPEKAAATASNLLGLEPEESYRKRVTTSLKVEVAAFLEGVARANRCSTSEIISRICERFVTQARAK